MPKTKTRKRSSAKSATTQKSRTSQSLRRTNTDGAVGTGGRQAPAVLAARRGGQNLLTAACVALGCWGFAFSFAFLTSDPNRYVYGGLAAVLALMWTLLFAMRLRKRLQQG